MNGTKFLRLLLPAALAFGAALFFCGCPLKVTINLDKNDNKSIYFSSSLGTAFLENLDKLQQVPGQDGGSSDNLERISKKIQTELNQSFFKNASVRFDKNILTASTQVNSQKTLPKDFLGINKSSSGDEFYVALNPQSLAAAILQENTTAKTLADILMAPIISGEQMSLFEYKDLLTEIYGAPLASELLSGDLTIEYIRNGKKQVQRVPVSDLLLAANGKRFVFKY
ncbi:MAG: hypothetical protein J6V90_11545 [Treponema sp.]|nr:hypothetical protein [Treponema sp.]